MEKTNEELESVVENILQEISNGSNIYDSLLSVYEELSVFGNAAIQLFKEEEG